MTMIKRFLGCIAVTLVFLLLAFASDALADTTAPQNLISFLVTETQVGISWDSVSGAQSYDVYENGNLLVSGVTDTSYVVQSLTEGTVYTFSVSAVGSDGTESPQSQGVQVVTRSWAALLGQFAVYIVCSCMCGAIGGYLRLILR